MLNTINLNAAYGETKVLYDVNISVKPSQVLAILGRNGAGKTTILKSIMGLLQNIEGKIILDQEDILSKPSYEIARAGIAYVPETRDIFPSLSVEENLKLATRIAPTNGQKWDMHRVLELFPRLKQRLSNGGQQLSGGEQQMLAIGRALLMNPKILILDEPTEGLAPIIIEQIHNQLQALKDEQLTIILVEQNLRFATSLADKVALVGRGHIVWEGAPKEVLENKELQSQWLGV